ncbi:hypothetical protein HYT24_01720 [Candidatus Pacearchaeota archaeon]|nr:hypothetical protein [Candidatus Pacearchaeota archaeon]
MMKRNGQILTETVVFITLNLIFLTILMLFVLSKTGNEAFYEEKYSKQIALMIDSAKPGMIIHLNMEDAMNLASKNKVPIENVVSINGNLVTVKLSDKSSQSYSFFNDVSVSAPYLNSEHTGYVFVINPNEK